MQSQQESIQTKAIDPHEAAIILKNLGYDGYVEDGLGFLGMFGAPGNSAHNQSAIHSIDQNRGWNHTAVLAKSLQFALGISQVFVSPETADRITDQSGDETLETAFTTGTEGYDVPSDWVIAPTEHRISKLMRRPNPWTDQAQFRFQISQHIETHGVCCLLVLPNQNGQPSEIYVIPRTQISSHAGDVRFPEGYYRTYNLSRFTCNREFQENSLTLQERLQSLSHKDYSAKYVIEIGLPSLMHSDDWTNPTSAMSDVLDTDKEMHRARRNILKNQATAGPMLSEDKGVDLQSDERQQILDEWQYKNAGSENQGKPWFKPKGVTVDDYSKSGREMEYTKSAEQSRDDILGQRLTPPAMVGLGDTASYAGVVGVVKAWSRMSGQPMMRLIAGQLTIGLQRFFSRENREFAIVLQAGNIDDPQTIQNQLNTDISAKAITTGEYRERRNMRPFGDERDDAIIGTLGQEQGIDGVKLPGSGLPGIAGGDTGPESPGIGTDAALREGTQVEAKEVPQEQAQAFSSLSRREFTNTRKAIMETLEALSHNQIREKTARVLLRQFGLSQQDVDEIVDSVIDEPDPMTRRSIEPDPEPEREEVNNEFAKSVFSGFLHRLQTPENVWGGFVKSGDCKRDGDGDGFVNDGTPEEKPADESCRDAKREKDESESSDRALASPAQLLDRIREDGGFTYQPIKGSHPDSGFSVAIFPEHELKVHRDKLSAADIAGYLLEKIDAIRADDRIHIGAWDNQKTDSNPSGDDIVYLDMSVVIDNREDAFDVAREHGQLGMFDLATGTTIEVMTKEQRREWERERESGGQSTKSLAQSPRYNPGRPQGVVSSDAEGPDRSGAQRGGSPASGRVARREAPRQWLTLKNGYTGYEVLPASGRRKHVYSYDTSARIDVKTYTPQSITELLQEAAQERRDEGDGPLV